MVKQIAENEVIFFCSLFQSGRDVTAPGVKPGVKFSFALFLSLVRIVVNVLVCVSVSVYQCVSVCVSVSQFSQDITKCASPLLCCRQ